MDIFILGLTTGLSYGMVLFLVATGFSMTWGLMGIVNLCHGTIFMVGGYIALTVARTTDSFILGIVSGALSAGIVGLIIERGFLSFLYKQFLDQVLVTYGFVYVITNATLWIWGPLHQLPYVPEYLSGSVLIGKFTFPFHRFAIIGVGLVMAAGLWWLQDKTRYGAIVRAGMEDADIS